MPPENPDDLSTLERMRRKLYSADAPEGFPAPALPRKIEAAQGREAWTPVEAPKPRAKRRISYAALFLGIAGVFFILTVAGASYFLMFGGRSVSTDRVVIAPDGPTSISSGDVVTLLIAIENGNPVPIQETMLSVEFPDTARSSENPEESFSRYEDTLGAIAPGETGTRSIQVALYGSENEQVIIPIRFEYRVEGSNATYVKEAQYDIVITSSPISIRAEAVSEVSAGQPLTFAVTVRSNAATALENVAVLAEYPFGFTPRRGEGPVFPIGTLEPGEERSIAVVGTIAGENDEERVFRFTAGTQRDEAASVLAVSYATAITPVGLKKPFLQTALSIDRDAGASPVIEAGVQVQSIVSWTNTLASAILDGQVEVRLTGTALDASSVNATSAFYRSSDTTIVYAKDTERALANLQPGATGSGTFSFKTKPAAELAGLRNPTITATVSVAGRRVGENNVPERVQSVTVRTIQVGTDLTLESGSRYSAGPFDNTGPWPPVADQETTYTIDFSLKNSVNTVADAVVTGVLPSYVRFTGAVSPADGSVTYNEATRTVTWRAGEIAPGTGYGTDSRQASFQVALLPSASQRGTSPVLVSGITAAGVDRFTQRKLEADVPSVTTQANNDPAYVQGNGQVR
ncbi:MAG: hypothetical protein V4644_01855 [Patescibacteria group bacterium]